MKRPKKKAPYWTKLSDARFRTYVARLSEAYFFKLLKGRRFLRPVARMPI